MPDIPKGAIVAKYGGNCPLCDKRYGRGDFIKQPDDRTYWAHSKCVNRDARERAAQQRIDANAEAGNNRRWQTNGS